VRLKKVDFACRLGSLQTVNLNLNLLLNALTGAAVGF
jgi:hypothetical protein